MIQLMKFDFFCCCFASFFRYSLCVCVKFYITLLYFSMILWNFLPVIQEFHVAGFVVSDHFFRFYQKSFVSCFLFELNNWIFSSSSFSFSDHHIFIIIINFYSFKSGIRSILHPSTPSKESYKKKLIIC